MKEDRKILRSASVSSTGKFLDRYFSGPYKMLGQPKSRSLGKSSSQHSIPLPRLRDPKIKIEKGQEEQSRSRSRKAKQIEIESKIKKEIAFLRQGSSKNKLQLEPRRSLQLKKQQPRVTAGNTEEAPAPVKSWKDLKRMAPSSGYLYVDCQSEPQGMKGGERKVTISEKWVLITEPHEQTLYKIDDYAQVLKKYEKLQRIDFFRNFKKGRIFRKWKLVSESHFLNNKKAQIASKLKKVYQDVYEDLTSLLQTIRKYKFLGASKLQTIPFDEFSDYLFNGSLKIIEEIHTSIFVKCVETCVRPIKEAMMHAHFREEEKRKFREDMGVHQQFIVNYLECEDEIVEYKIQQRVKKLRFLNPKATQTEYSYIKSTAFIGHFLDFFKILKKCLFIINQAYLFWVQSVQQEILGKLQAPLKVWNSHKGKFMSIMMSLTDKKTDKYQCHTSELGHHDVQTISYLCELDQSKKITFGIKKEQLLTLLEQYVQYLMMNLSYRRMLECYGFEKYSISSYTFEEEVSSHPQLELLLEVTKTNDCYNIQELLRKVDLNECFHQELDSLLSRNFEEVEDVLSEFNSFIEDMYEDIETYQKVQIPSETYNYLQKLKNKLLYLPKTAEVGLFSLDFSAVHDSLLMDIGLIQMDIYINVPANFKSLYQKIKNILSQIYSGMGISLWSLEDILKGHKYFESYEEYKFSGSLHNDMNRLKGFLNVISSKCLEEYEPSFRMYLQVKDLKDRIDIKSNIFSQKLPKRLLSLKDTIQILKEKIWSDLGEQQNVLNNLGKDEMDIFQKLDLLLGSREKLSAVKENMVKLEDIGKLQDRYFIDQDLTVNTHSYQKMSNDIQLLSGYIKKYLRFKERMEKITPDPILSIKAKVFLEEILLNIKEVNEDYLLLISYETTIKEILDSYNEWKKYLSTIQELCCLSAEDLEEVELLKELRLRHELSEITLGECIEMNLHSIFNEIYQIKMVKLKKLELFNSFENIDELENEKPFVITTSELKAIDKEVKSCQASIRKISSQRLSPMRSSKSSTNNTNFQFQNIPRIIKTIEQTKNHIISLTSSIYLNDFRVDIAVKVEQLQKIEFILSEFLTIKDEYQDLMLFEYFQNTQIDTVDSDSLKKMLINEENNNFFSKYNILKQHIREDWLKVVYLLEKKNIRVLTTSYEESRGFLESIKLKMKKLKQLVSELIEEISKEITMFNLLDTTTILHIIQNPNYFFELFYPIRTIEKRDKTIKITTIYDEVMEFDIKQGFKDHIAELNGLEAQITEEVRKEVKENKDNNPIDFLLNYMDEQLPLQVVYSLDQIYLSSSYLKIQKAPSLLIKNLDGQIKLICRNSFKEGFSGSKFNYSIALFNQLLESRIEMRERIEICENQLWFNNILVTEIFEGTLCFKNFNTRFLCSYHLVDHTKLSFIFPWTEKMLVKVCNRVNLQENLVVEQLELVENISARMMTIFFKVALSKENISKVLSVCLQRFPIFVVGMVGSNLNEELIYVYEELNRIEKCLDFGEPSESLEKNSKLLPSLFILPQQIGNYELSQTLKLRFRIVAAVYPCPKIILNTKMLVRDYLIEKGIFSKIVFVLRSYVTEMKSKNIYLSYTELTQICECSISKLKDLEGKRGYNDNEILNILFSAYFRAIGVNFQEQILLYVKFKESPEFSRTSLYELVQSIVKIHQKQSIQEEAFQVNFPTEQVSLLKNYFKQYLTGLTFSCRDLSAALEELFQIVLNFKKETIAIIGPHQSGKSLLLHYFQDFLEKALGHERISWKYCDVQIFNNLTSTLMTEQELISFQLLDEEDFKKISWLVFEHFIPEGNEALLSYVFQPEQSEEELQFFSSFSKATLSFCEFYNKKEKISKNLKKIHSKYICFELSDLKDVSPSNISMLTKIYLSEHTIGFDHLYNLLLKNFLLKMQIKDDVLISDIKQLFKNLFPYLEKLIDDIVNVKSKAFEWLMVVTPIIVLERTLTYFFSFFGQDGISKLELLCENKDREKAGKLLTYCLFSTLQQAISLDFHYQLQKIVKTNYSKLKEEEQKDRFLLKTVIFTSKHLQFIDADSPYNMKQHFIQNLYEVETIETNEIMTLISKFMNQLAEIDAPVMVIGKREGGKTTFIRSFLRRVDEQGLVITGSPKKTQLIELNNKVSVCVDNKKEFTALKRRNFIIFIDDVSEEKDVSIAQRYLIYLIKHGFSIGSKKLYPLSPIAGIFERQCLSYQLGKKFWFTYVISFQTDKEYFTGVFAEFLKNKLTYSLRDVHNEHYNLSSLRLLAENSLKMMRYCQKSFKKSVKTWTYDFSMSHCKQLLEDLVIFYNYEKNPKEKDFLRYAGMTIFQKIQGRLQSEKEVDDFQNQVKVNIIPSVQFIEMKNQFQREAILFQNSLQRDKLLNKVSLQNVLLTEDVISFACNLKNAFSTADLVLVNKVNIALNASIASVAVELLEFENKELSYCQTEDNFLNQIQKIIEQGKKQGLTVLYFISFEQIITNPDVIIFISNYIRRNEEQSTKSKEACFCHPCKFIIEYSTQHLNSISYFLDCKIAKRSHVLFFKNVLRLDPSQRASKIITRCKEAQAIDQNQLNVLVKQAIRLFQDLKNFECPKSIDRSNFHANYMFSQQNFELFLFDLISSYSVIVKKGQNKKRMLQLSLSQLGFMFKEYKQVKKMASSLYIEEGSIRDLLSRDRETVMRLKNEFKSAQNQKIVEKIQQNDLEIQDLHQKIQQLQTSEKTWEKIYKNAQMSISRTEFAEFKYLFLTNYSNDKELFELIAFILGENTDLLSLKKSFSDINIIARIKDTSIPSLPKPILEGLKVRLDSINKKGKLSCSRNLLEWANLGCRLGLHLIEKEDKITRIEERIAELNKKNQTIREKTNIDDLEKTISQIEKRINNNNSQLTLVQLKLKKTLEEAEQFEKEFDALIHFQTYCLEELENLKTHMLKLEVYCFMQALDFTILCILQGDFKIKMREISIAKLRKTFGFVSSPQQNEYFKLLRRSGDEKETESRLLRPREYLSVQKKQMINQINKYLTQNDGLLAVIDRRGILSLDTTKTKSKTIKLSDLIESIQEYNFDEYSLIIVESDTWEISIKMTENHYEGMGRYHLLRFKDIRMAIPASIPIIFVFKSWGNDEFVFNFKIIDLEMSERDFDETISFMIDQEKNVEDNREEMFEKSLMAENAFMKIVNYLCKQNQEFSLKSKNLIKNLTVKIQKLDEENSKIRHMVKVMSLEHKEGKEEKVSKIISKLFSMSIRYFPFQEQTSIYYRNILESSFRYIKMEGSKGDFSSMIAFVLEFLTEGLINKFQFYYLYYIKILAVEERIATLIESQNLSFVSNPAEEFSKNMREVKTDVTSLANFLQYPTVELERTYSKVVKSNIKSEKQLNELIQSENLSFFNKLILKKVIIPKKYELEIENIVRKIENEVMLKYVALLKKLEVKDSLFCVCDASYWVSKLKFPHDFNFFSFSQIKKKRKGKEDFSRLNEGVWVIFDDINSSVDREKILGYLSKTNNMGVNLIILLKDFPNAKYQQMFKYIPFKRLINIFQIKELVRVSQGQYSSIFKKINRFKSELMSTKPFNERIANTLLYEQLRGQISSNQEYTIDQIFMQIDWCFFQWDPAYNAINKRLTEIINSIEASPSLLQKYSATDKFLCKVESVLKRPFELSLTTDEVIKLEKQLKDEGLMAMTDITPVQQYLNNFKAALYYHELQFKRERLVTLLQNLNLLSGILKGQVDINGGTVRRFKDLLANFKTGALYDKMIQVAKWKKFQGQKNVLHLSLIESRLTIFFLFETWTFQYYEFSLSQIATPPQEETSKGTIKKQLKEVAEEDEKSSISSNRDSETSPYNEVDNRIFANRRSRITSQSFISRNRKQSAFSSTEKSRKSFTQDLTRQSEQQTLMTTNFAGHLYYINSKIVGLRPLKVKEFKKVEAGKIKKLGFLDNSVTIHIVDFCPKKDLTKRTVTKRQSAFLPISNARLKLD